MKLDLVLCLATAAYAAPVPGVAAELTETALKLGLERHPGKTRQWLSNFAKKHVGDSVERLQKALQVSNKSKQKFEEQVVQRQKAVDDLHRLLSFYKGAAGRDAYDAHDSLTDEIYQDMKNLQVNSKQLKDLLKLTEGLDNSNPRAFDELDDSLRREHGKGFEELKVQIVAEFRERELKKAQKRLQDQQQTSEMIERELAKHHKYSTPFQKQLEILGL
jgi:hypothetical protein